MLAGVLAAWDAETELEVEALQQPSSEVVPLDHAEVVDGNVSYCELHPAMGRSRTLTLLLKQDILPISHLTRQCSRHLFKPFTFISTTVH